MSDGSQAPDGQGRGDEGMGRGGFLLLAAGAAAAGVGVLMVRRNLHDAPTQVAATEERAATLAARPEAASQPATQVAGATGPETQPATMATEPASQPAVAQTQPAQPATPAPDLPHELFPDATGKAIATADDAPVIMVPRSHWTSEKPNLSDIVLMGGFEKITVHHTGFATPWETDTWNPTKEEIETIRAFHAGSGATDRHWADIAYHFIVDRAGRVWQARPLVYQGAHVAGHNVHNIGVVLLGNFDLQRGSAAQLTSLCAFVGFLRKIYQIKAEDLHTHGELGKTDCPGKSLAAFVARTRAELIAAEGA